MKIGNMIGQSFAVNASELPESVIQSAKEEGSKIWNSAYTSKDSFTGRSRSKTDIVRDCLIGKIGEYILTKHFGYTKDDEDWHDLISSTGVRTEVKTWRTSSKSMERKIQEELDRIKRKKSGPKRWFNSTELVIIQADDDYTFTIHSSHKI